MTKIKICGLKTPQDVDAVNEIHADFAGMVLFCEKSRRNISIEQASKLRLLLNPEISSVAVVVSPMPEHADQIQRAGFDYIQIHGNLSPETLDILTIPVLKAFNVTDMETYEKWECCDKIAGYVFDAAMPGSGSTFDWSALKKLPRGDKFWMLAGGLTAENVADAIRVVSPDGVDVSSGVETPGKDGKDADKIRRFSQAVLNAQGCVRSFSG